MHGGALGTPPGPGSTPFGGFVRFLLCARELPLHARRLCLQWASDRRRRQRLVRHEAKVSMRVLSVSLMYYNIRDELTMHLQIHNTHTCAHIAARAAPSTSSLSSGAGRRVRRSWRAMQCRHELEVAAPSGSEGGSAPVRLPAGVWPVAPVLRIRRQTPAVRSVLSCYPPHHRHQY